MEQVEASWHIWSANKQVRCDSEKICVKPAAAMRNKTANAMEVDGLTNSMGAPDCP
jgi:hypothetical protein